MAGTDYSTYLRIPELLTLQQPLTPDAADELLFIVVHQSYELWFKVVIDELQRAVGALEATEPWRAVQHLRRVITVDDLLLGHLATLETMSPEGFLAFRDPLDPASGFQSFQFRAIEFLSGGGQEGILNFRLFDESTRAWLRTISEQRNLADAFEQCLRECTGQVDCPFIEVVRALYLDHQGDPVRTTLHQVAELMIDHDERLTLWRHHHMLMAGRQIGRRPGTGGSEGMAYLATTLSQRFYPVLWDVRSAL